MHLNLTEVRPDQLTEQDDLCQFLVFDPVKIKGWMTGYLTWYEKDDGYSVDDGYRYISRDHLLATEGARIYRLPGAPKSPAQQIDDFGEAMRQLAQVCATSGPKTLDDPTLAVGDLVVVPGYTSSSVRNTACRVFEVDDDSVTVEMAWDRITIRRYGGVGHPNELTNLKKINVDQAPGAPFDFTVKLPENFGRMQEDPPEDFPTE